MLASTSILGGGRRIGSWFQNVAVAVVVFGFAEHGHAQSEGAATAGMRSLPHRGSAIGWANCDHEASAEAERLLVETREFADRGVMSRFDVMEAEFFAMDTKYCAKELSKSQFCAQKQTLFTEFTRRLQELLAGGHGRYLLTRRDWVRLSAEISTVCGG